MEVLSSKLTSQDSYITVKDACDTLGISRRTLYNWFEKFKIQTKKRGNKLLILTSDLAKAKDRSENTAYESRSEMKDMVDQTYDLLKSAINTLQDELRIKNKVIEDYTIQRTNALLLQEAKTIEENTKRKSKVYRVGFFIMSLVALVLLLVLWTAVIATL